MARAVRVFLGMVVCAALVAPAAAQDTGVVLDYDVHYGVLPIMTIHTTTELDRTQYRTRSDMRTVGAVRLLFPWSASSVASGQRNDGELRPALYRSIGEYRGERRLAEITYTGDGTVQARSEPPADEDDREPVARDLQDRTIDPLTATLAALARNCRGTLPVFDGRRRYDIALTDLGEEPSLPSSRPNYAGPARHCRGVVTPLGGFWRSSARRGEEPKQLDYWIAPPRPGLMAIPVYLELAAPAGTLAISLTQAESLPTGERVPPP